MKETEEKETSEYLACILSEKELIDRSKALAKANEDLAQVEAKKKDVMADITAQQKKHEANIGALSRIVSSGKEYRDVKCIIRLDYKAGRKTITRCDTSEIIKTSELTQGDRQANLAAA